MNIKKGTPTKRKLSEKERLIPLPILEWPTFIEWHLCTEPITTYKRLITVPITIFRVK